MWKHLKSIHPEEHSKLKGTSSTENKDKQTKIDSFTSHKQSVDEKQQIEEKIARIMLRQNIAFTFFDDKDLKDIISRAYPNIEIGGRQHFRRKVVPRMAENVREVIGQKIGKSYYSLTSDGWSQPVHAPHLQSLTIHYVDDSFQRYDYVLAAFSMDGLSHTGQNISDKIEQCLAKNGFLTKNCVSLIRDDASNMKLAAQLIQIPSFQCSAHFLHLCMHDALKIDFIQEIISKCIRWVKFCRTTIGRAILKRHQQEQNVNEKQLILGVKTRWNSVHHMLQQFREQKKALLSIELERQQINSGIRFAPKRPRLQEMNTVPTDLPQLTQLDFDLLKKICPILKIFETETLKFSLEQSTASTIIPTLKKIGEFLCTCDSFSENLEPFVQNLSGVLGKRLKNLNDNKLLQMTTLIDPRFSYSEDYFTKFMWTVIEEDFLDFAKTHTETGSNTIAEEVQLEQELDLDMESAHFSGSSDESITYDIWKPKSPAAISLPSTLSGEDALLKRPDSIVGISIN